ncbi:MAG: hypothetical protein HYS04_13050 [Acidobacteria bacterium]|nr:hypothetical protein [Acidobacteriota bacterium]
MIEKVEAVAKEALAHLGLRPLALGCLATALMRDGLDGKEFKSIDVAKLVKFCDVGDTMETRKAAAQRVRNAKHDAAGHYGCKDEHPPVPIISETTSPLRLV